MKKKLIFGAALALPVAAFVWAQAGNLSIIVNGKSVSGKTLASKGQTYVPVSALRAAGATTTIKNGALVITFGPAGGANQLTALEGGLNEWLFNGIWRFRVTSVTPTADRPGWKLAAELRNGTKLDSVALGGTGFESITLVMADGNPVGIYNITDLDKPVGQGGSVIVDLIFYDDDGNGRKPEKLLLKINPDKPTIDFLKRQGASYSVADPSFRIKLP